ncbi:unnamed protein product [Rhizophagus irregularis]|uniref:Uncharacterized protein n=1 Tax=Rhizophagus irregularis TaxID=588596 RepID=A0A915YVU5_9GLOM|nr:unnamed protein product [Rhizophagus irregularis]
MNWFIHLFIFNLFILTSTAGGDSTCICNSGGGFGLFCGFDLASSDCSGEILAHILQCGGKNTKAQDLGPCTYGCCSQDSHCCLDKECTGCPDSKWQKPMFSTQSNTTASTPTTYQPKSTSSIQTSAAPSGSSSGSSSVSPSDIATILGAVIGGICAIFAAIIGVKCKRQKQNKLNSQNKVNSQNKQISQNDQISQNYQNGQNQQDAYIYIVKYKNFGISNI